MKENIKKKQKEFQKEMFREVDSLFPKGKSKERGNALVLVAMAIMKCQKLLEDKEL